MKKNADYQSMYYSLFNDVTEALDHLQKSEDVYAKRALEVLAIAQRKTEQIYIDSEFQADNSTE